MVNEHGLDNNQIRTSTLADYGIPRKAHDEFLSGLHKSPEGSGRADQAQNKGYYLNYIIKIHDKYLRGKYNTGRTP